MKIVLVHPQIPPNTGNVVRLCAVTGASLVLVRPLGFSINDRQLRRAGLDHWLGVDVQVVDALEPLLEGCEAPFYFFSTKAERCYSEERYSGDAWLIFGSETAGLPAAWHRRWADRFLTIPMVEGQRSLNLSNSCAIVLYEAWRQQGFGQG